MATLWVRKATYEDIDEIDKIFTQAKAFLKSQGLTQWQDASGYPNYIDAKDDIDNDSLFVCVDGNVICGVCAYKTGINEDYDIIYDGSWENEGEYLTIHRTATKESYRGMGVGKVLFDFAYSFAKELGLESIRIDTHELNKPMRSLATKSGYREAGVIYIKRTDNDPKRIVYEKIIK